MNVFRLVLMFWLIPKDTEGEEPQRTERERERTSAKDLSSTFHVEGRKVDQRPGFFIAQTTRNTTI